tara:strand:+ start:5594 stop:5833 length:240 start_codon:yes stop_codon:yes gene_type:complete
MKFLPPVSETPVVATYQGEWVILEGDPRALSMLQGAKNSLAGQYFPGTWAMMNACANLLGGRMLDDAPPQGNTPEGVVF